VRVRSGLLPLLLSTLALGAACSGSEGPAPASGGDASTSTGGLTGDVSCVSDPRVDTYVAGLSREGERGTLSFRLESSDPAPPAKGGNTFEIVVLDSDGVPVTGDLRIELTMPDHGHGTQVEPEVSYDAATERFTIAPVYLFMAGVWRVTLELAAGEPSKVVDRASFYFCVEG
jgi:hypothetical protein